MCVYPNIEVFIVRLGIKKKAIAKELGISEKTLRNKLSGESDFTFGEAMQLKETFFPAIGLEELFEKRDASN